MLLTITSRVILHLSLTVVHLIQIFLIAVVTHILMPCNFLRFPVVMCCRKSIVLKVVSRLGLIGYCQTSKKFGGISVAPAFTQIFNISLKVGKVPQYWNHAFVVPLHKSGKRELISNYRPISLCSIPCKMFERIMVKRLLEHSQKYGIIPDSQHGFLPKRYCTTQAVSLFYEWAKILDRSTPPRIDAVLLDWAKAFDKVNHHVLLTKLQIWCVRQSASLD